MPDPLSSPRSRLLLGAGLIALAFAIAIGAQYRRIGRAEADVERARRTLALAELEATLGAATVETMRGSYEIGRQLASAFFSGLQQHVAQAPAAAREEYRAILGQRDAVITMLSRGDSQSGSLLAQLFTRYRLARHGPDRSLPIPAPTPTPAAPDTQRAPEKARDQR